MPLHLAGSYSRRQLQPGEAGIWQTVRTIRNAVHAEKALPIVRAYAGRIAAECGPQDQACRARRLFDFVRRVMPYVPDPVGVEAFGTPSFHLENVNKTGQTYGDCDDGAGLLATLLESVGVPARLVVASFRDDAKFHHIWAEAYADGKWLELDPFRAERFDGRPTRLFAVEL